MFLCPTTDARALRNFAFMLASSRNDKLTFEDVALSNTRGIVIGGGASKYTVRCFAEDHQTIFEYADQLMKVGGLKADLQKVLADREARNAKNLLDVEIGHRIPEGDPR